MPNNRNQAKQRLALLSRRFDKDPRFREAYTEFMTKVIDKGYAQRVLPDNLPESGKVWYLPHHGVFHPKKNKIRVVFDCAAQYGGTSLNDQLLQGPNLTSSLVGTLTRFRQEPVAVMGDIESMFCQIHVSPKDRNFQRFLWWNNGDTSTDPVEFQMTVHLFGATSSPSCASFALRQTTEDMKGHFNDEVVNIILRNFYVDDCLKSVETEHTATSLIKDLQAVLKGRGFHITKWVSNSRRVMTSVPASERAAEVRYLDLDADKLPVERTLGVNWSVESDAFSFTVDVKDHAHTRRGLLSTISSIYDPLGFIAPMILVQSRCCKSYVGCKFTRVGVDYFGPFGVKVKRSHVKRYCAIFTCLASRAVHIEVAHSLDTDSYINALRRFIARRGQVQKMVSDNGTNFVGAERELREALNAWNIAAIDDAMRQKNIEWQFNPPAGSHFGGVWERLIRSIRSAINSTVREQVLDDERLVTLLCEVEAVLNSRPITRISDQPNDLEALTPNHLLLQKKVPNLPPGLFDKADNYARRRWRQVQYMSNIFWHRWVREYLPILQERQKWTNIKRNLSVGDVVLVVDSNAPRNSWPLALVKATMPDKTGLVRQVTVRTATNTLIRPIDKLCLILEMD